MTVVGNVSAMDGSESTGEPFVIAAAPEEYVQMGVYGVAVPLDGAQSVVISLSGAVEKVQELDAKFIKTALAQATDGLVRPANTDQAAYGRILMCLGVNDGVPAWAVTTLPDLCEEINFAHPGYNGFFTYSDGAYRRVENAFTFNTMDYSLNGVVLRAPGGNLFRVHVQDDGTVTSTAVE